MATSGESCKEPLAVIPHDDDAVICRGVQERNQPPLDAIPAEFQPVPRCDCGAPAWNYLENSPEKPPRYSEPQPLCRAHRLWDYADSRAASADARQRLRQEQRERMAEAAYRRLKDTAAPTDGARPTGDQDPHDGRQTGPARRAADGPRIPQYPGVWVRWRSIWLVVQSEVGKRTYKEMSRWLKKSHPGLACSRETLSKICSAGSAGGLDELVGLDE
jgi:hypothetical protein